LEALVHNVAGPVWVGRHPDRVCAQHGEVGETKTRAPKKAIVS
jgi:hypothetical protein